jgi:spore maturation protein CgeB
MPSVLLAGDWLRSIYEPALAAGFHAIGWSVARFRSRDCMPKVALAPLQSRLKIGPAVAQTNRALLTRVDDQAPTLLFLHSTDLVFPSTLARIKVAHPGTVVVAFHNDNPYVGWRDRLKWRHFLGGLRLADLALVYRPSDVAAAHRWGARRVAEFPPYYVSYLHHPVAVDDSSQHDVVFIGHYEDDGRIETLDTLHWEGIEVQILGNQRYWRRAARKLPWLKIDEIDEVWENQYSTWLSKAKIGLVFLSSRNRDVWTRRCLEIPACGTFMLAPRTRELEGWFADGREAVFYDGPHDLARKIKYYLAHEAERRQIAAAGHQRCLRDGHDEVSRIKQLIEMLHEAGYPSEHPGPL